MHLLYVENVCIAAPYEQTLQKRKYLSWQLLYEPDICPVLIDSYNIVLDFTPAQLPGTLMVK